MFKLKQLFMQEAGEGAEGGGGQGPQITPEIQALIDAQVNQAVTGLKAKNAELLGKVKTAGDQLKEFEGIDPNAVRTILQRFSDDEEAKLIASGKIDEVLNKRTERMKQGFEQETAKERQAREAAEQRAEKFTRRVLENSIRAEASAAGIHQHAVEDALFRAQSLFQLDEDGNPVASEGLFGKDGKPLTLKEWMAEMKDKAPHWWPATANGGGSQPNGGAKGKKTINRAAFDQLDPVGKAEYIRSGGAVTD
jgi:hypothetical protein